MFVRTHEDKKSTDEFLAAAKACQIRDAQGDVSVQETHLYFHAVVVLGLELRVPYW